MFDEGFLRQLERLGVLMKQPVRGGLKGGRRSVKRGQSVEFADYRDYTLGDDLRQLDWNVYARLERLFVKLFVEEEDVTITFLLDASPSMAYGRPAEAAVREARGGGPRVHRARRARTAWSHAALSGRMARRHSGLRGSGRVFRLLGNLSAIQPAEGPTDLLASRPATPAAMLSGPGRRGPALGPARPGADRVVRELAATGSELIVLHALSPDELDPQLEGDLKLVDSETGERDRRDGGPRRRSTTTRRGSPPGRTALADLATKRRASYVPIVHRHATLNDLVFAELRRRRVVG